MKPGALDFSEDGRFPGVVEVTFGSGYKFASAVSNEQAGEVVSLLTKWVVEDAPAPEARGG